MKLTVKTLKLDPSNPIIHSSDTSFLKYLLFRCSLRLYLFDCSFKCSQGHIFCNRASDFVVGLLCGLYARSSRQEQFDKSAVGRAVKLCNNPKFLTVLLSLHRLNDPYYGIHTVICLFTEARDDKLVGVASGVVGDDDLSLKYKELFDTSGTRDVALLVFFFFDKSDVMLVM
ncbi:hypothetical protein Syun_013800 [Stephania yunnanensis]|uniref:Uncharacterized protein n=1 Tax=Stephania yunnanensis TaxID=152371 RepID=A0AAP0PB67_9MAGN